MARIALAAAILALLAATAAAETVDGNRIIVLDGDTVALPCARPARGCAEKLRLYAIDAPESFRPRCDAEEIAWLEAKARLAELLRGQAVDVRRGEPGTGRQHDVYGRTLGALVTPAGDVATLLLREDLVLPWHPGHAAHQARLRTWCGR